MSEIVLSFMKLPVKTIVDYRLLSELTKDKMYLVFA